MIDRLLSPEVQQYIRDHQHDDPFLLSLRHKKNLMDFPLREAIEQIHSLQKARTKLPSWAARENIIWPAPKSVEQASSEITAKFKASLVSGKSFLDLTGGMGVDCIFFADQFEEVHYVESDAALCALARHNFGMLGFGHIQIHNITAEAFLTDCQKNFDAIFIDPSRRFDSKKVFKIEDCSPNLYDILPKCKSISNQVLVKLSPLIDLSFLVKEFQPESIWGISVRNEVKEVLCLVQRGNKTQVKIEAVDFLANGDSKVFKFLHHREAEAKSDFSSPLTYIYEPNAAILKAGAFKLIGNHYELKKLHQHTHLYTSDEIITDFPGRIYKVMAELKPDKKEISGAVPGKKINVLTRNFPLTPAQLKKKFGLIDGGEDFLIGTTLMDGKKVLLRCSRIMDGPKGIAGLSFKEGKEDA
jgi:predicted O-methyltransferase YrrM